VAWPVGAGRSDARAKGASERWSIQLAGPLLLVAAAAGLLGQGAYYPSVQRLIGLLIVAATLLGLAAWPPTRDDLRLLPVVPALALAAWAVLDGALVGGVGVGPASLVVGVVAVLVVCRRLPSEDRQILLAGVIGIGLLVAVIGWLGVAGRVGAWAFQAQGLWRASSTLTYPNATAAVLAPIGLVVLGRRIASPGSVPLAVAAAGLLAGMAATMSRAGVLALMVGLGVLAGLQGLRATAWAAVGPVAGALVAMLCLLPSMTAASPPRPALALVGLCAGLGLAALVARVRRWLALVLLGGVLLAGIAGLLAGTGGVGRSAQSVADARADLASPDRTGALHAALRLVAQQPLTGTGPGHANLRWKGHDHGTQLFTYVHNEYLQVTAELGLVGLVLLAILLAAIAHLLWRARPTRPAGATWAGVAAACSRCSPPPVPPWRSSPEGCSSTSRSSPRRIWWPGALRWMCRWRSPATPPAAWTSSSASARRPGPASPRASAPHRLAAPDRASKSSSVSEPLEGRPSSRAPRWRPPRFSAATGSPAVARQIARPSRSNGDVTTPIHRMRRPG
jgi:O-antigen ligase